MSEMGQKPKLPHRNTGVRSSAVNGHALWAVHLRARRGFPLYPRMSLRPHTLPAGFIAPCLPTNTPQPPCGEAWLHEIKHDGFRVIARKDGKHVKLYGRPGNDLTYCFRFIVEALAKLRSRSCVGGRSFASTSPLCQQALECFVVSTRPLAVRFIRSRGLLLRQLFGRPLIEGIPEFSSDHWQGK
jgi:hypothetical protein